VAFLAAKARQSGPAGDAIPVGARPLSHRDRKGLRCRQTLVRRSGFADRKTQPRRGSAGGDESAGGAARESDAGAIGPPSQQVSRIAPHWRHMSLARISNVSPWQIGQRQAVMAAHDTGSAARGASKDRKMDARRHGRDGEPRERVGHARGPPAGSELPAKRSRACHHRERAILTPVDRGPLQAVYRDPVRPTVRAGAADHRPVRLVHKMLRSPRRAGSVAASAPPESEAKATWTPRQDLLLPRAPKR
jgi:hypothetical protein